MHRGGEKPTARPSEAWAGGGGLTEFAQSSQLTGQGPAGVRIQSR